MSLRTVAYWEAGRCRVPWSVVRLLRILRLGDLGALSRDWSGWSLHDGRLHSPEGRAFTPQESAWWALLVAQARAFMDGRTRLGGVGAAAPARPQAVSNIAWNGVSLSGPAVRWMDDCGSPPFRRAPIRRILYRIL